MSVKDQSSRAGVHSISDGLTVTHLFVCMKFNLFLYILLSLLVSFHWSLLGKALCCPDNHPVSHLMCNSAYIMYVYDRLD